MKFLCDNCKAKYQIGDEKVAGKAVRMKCRRCGHEIHVTASQIEGARAVEGPTFTGTIEPLTSITPPSVDVSSLPPTPAPKPTPSPGYAARPNIRDETRPVVDDESTAIMTAPPKPFMAPKPAAATPAKPGVPVAPAAPSAPAAPAAPRGPRPGQATLLGVAAPRPPAAAAPVGAPAPKPAAPAAAPAPRPGTITRSPVAPASPAAARAPAPAAPSAPKPQAPAPAPAPPAVSANEEWYVGINGVPLGPVRVAVIRDKALAGLVDGESLVWRDGQGEWKALKYFPELLEVVASATAARAIAAAPVPPAPAPPAPAPAPAPAPMPSARSVAALSPRVTMQSFSAPIVAEPAPSPIAAPAPAPSPIAAPAPAPSPIAAPAPASAVSLFTATPQPAAPQAPQPAAPPAASPISVLADPFAATAPKPFAPEAPPATALPMDTPLPAPPARPLVVLDLDEPVRVKRSHGPPAMAYAFIAMAAVFGGVAAWVLLSKPQQIIVVQQQPAPVASTAGANPDKSAPIGQVEVGEPTPADSGNPAAKPVLGHGPLPKASATASPPSAPIDTSGFTSTVPGPVATAQPPSVGGAGGQLSAGEIQGVVAANTPRVRRKCWQPALDAKSPSAPSSARVDGNITIGPSGNVDSASASGGEKDFPGLSSCIAASMKAWKFPASGGSQPARIPFVFAGQ